MAGFWIIRKRARAQGDLDRRRFLAHAAAFCAIPLLGERVEGRTVRGFRVDADPFSVGVASGDPTSTAPYSGPGCASAARARRRHAPRECRSELGACR